MKSLIIALAFSALVATPLTVLALRSPAVYAFATGSYDPVLKVERHKDVVTISVGAEHATVALDTFKQVLVNEGIQ